MALKDCMKLIGSPLSNFKLRDLVCAYHDNIAKEIIQYFETNFYELDDTEFNKAVDAFTLLRRRFYEVWKRVQYDTMTNYNISSIITAEEYTGCLFVSSVENLSKCYMDKVKEKGFVSARYCTSDNFSYYEQERRNILLSYDITVKQLPYLIGVSKGDATTHPIYLPDSDRLMFEQYLFYKLLFDEFIKAEVTLGLNYCDFYPALSINELGNDNEFILSSEAEPQAIIITKRYKEEFSGKDRCGVKAYSVYAELPIYEVKDNKLILIE